VRLRDVIDRERDLYELYDAAHSDMPGDETWTVEFDSARSSKRTRSRSIRSGRRQACRQGGAARGLERVSGAPFVHVSVDLVDPDLAPGVGSPVRCALSYRVA
jgi:arginase family enzyme